MRTSTTSQQLCETFSHSLKRPAAILAAVNAEKATVNPMVWSVKSHRAGCQFDTVRYEFERNGR